MTRSEMMAIATAICETAGRAYVTTAATQNAVANRRMGEFAAATRCLYDDAVPLTLISGTATYDLRGAQLTKRVLEADAVTINGTPLLSYGGSVGMVSVAELRQREINYLADVAAQPTRACLMPPQTLRLWPKPDLVYSNCFVAGPTLPADIDTAGAGDAISIAFAPEDCEAVAIFVALGLIGPLAAGESDYERMAVFSKAAAERFQALVERTEKMLSGPAVRGGGSSGVRMVSLG